MLEEGPQLGIQRDYCPAFEYWETWLMVVSGSLEFPVGRGLASIIFIRRYHRRKQVWRTS